MYDQVITINVSKLQSQIACPHAVDNVKPIKQVLGTKINQIVIGSCTNGRLDDLAIAAKILKGKKVAQGTRMLIFPASTAHLPSGPEKGLCRHLYGGRCGGHELGLRSLSGYSPGRAGATAMWPWQPPTATSRGAWAIPTPRFTCVRRP